jgi:hypothetical protein
MPTFVPDFGDWLESELRDSRDRLDLVLERTEALAELHTHALDLAVRLKKPLTIEDVFQSPKTEKEKAHLRLLADRITREGEGGQPAYEVGGERGNHLETGARL